MFRDIVFIVISGFLGYIIGWNAGPTEECPKVILGYNCNRAKGLSCNHSRLEVTKAKKIMGRNYWDGKE